MGADAKTNPTNIIQVGQAKANKKTRTSKPQLKVDTDIQFLCSQLDEEAYLLLEKGIRENGCLDKIIYWKDHDTIIDGHNRYKICNDLGKKFKCIPMHFETKEEVMNYVIDHQLGRRNLSDTEKSYLRGRRYLTEKKAAHRPNSSELHQNDGVTGETAQRIADKNGVSQATIERDAVLAEAIDKTREVVGDAFIKSLRAGKVKISKKGIIGLSEKSPEDLKAIVEQIEKGETMSDAEKIVQSNKAPSLDANSDTTTLPEKDRDIEKIEGYLAQVLKILGRMMSTSQPDKLVELSEMTAKICDRLKEIGTINPDSSSQDADDESDDLVDMQVLQEGCSESIAYMEDDVSEIDDDEEDSLDNDR
jgi:ParB-like chromosome segregation protein Spo0J